jgi:hypothetical protein
MLSFSACLCLVILPLLTRRLHEDGVVVDLVRQPKSVKLSFYRTQAHAPELYPDGN